MSRVLVVDDEPADLRLMGRGLEKIGHEVVFAETGEQGLKILCAEQPDVAILDFMLPDLSGLDLLRRIREIDEHVPVIFVTSGGDSTTAIEAMKLGALDYLVKPINIGELRKIVERAVEIRRLTERPVSMDADGRSTDSQAIIGRCPAMQEVYKAIGIVAAQNVTVLIRGESGTGKELVARALYQHSDRVKGPFLAVNCAAIPETLLESELFGHERGAFTGADRKRIGKFEQANRGTLFLDEIGDMSPVLQSKLLRVLQECRFERVGGNETIETDVRVIAATNCRLEEMVAAGQFRPDLYYRLNGFSIHLPPLRERGTDLDSLVDHFRRSVNRDLKKNVTAVSPEAMRVLRDYSWPGNVRELQNVIRQGVLKTTGPMLLPDFLPDFVTRPEEANALCAGTEPDGSLDRLIEENLKGGSPHLYDDVVSQVEERLVSRVLEHAGGDKAEAVRLLGVNPALLRSHAALELLDMKSVREYSRPAPLVRSGMTMHEIERQAIRQALEETGGCRKEAAKLLGISVRTMQRKVKDLEIER